MSFTLKPEEEKALCSACLREVSGKEKPLKYRLFEVFRHDVAKELAEEAKRLQMHVSCLIGIKNYKPSPEAAKMLLPEDKRQGQLFIGLPADPIESIHKRAAGYYAPSRCAHLHSVPETEPHWHIGDYERNDNSIFYELVNDVMPSNVVNDIVQVTMSTYPPRMKEELQHLKNLRSMYLELPSIGHIKTMNRIWHMFPKLEYLEISNFQNEEISEEAIKSIDFGKLQHLKKFRVSQPPHITRAYDTILPKSITKARNLEVLDVSGIRGLMTLPRDLDKLEKLKILRISPELASRLMSKGVIGYYAYDDWCITFEREELKDLLIKLQHTRMN